MYQILSQDWAWNSQVLIPKQTGKLFENSDRFTLRCYWDWSGVQSVLRRFVFCSNFQKNRLVDFQKCRIFLIWAALETSDPGASNGGSNVQIWLNAADLIAVEMSRLTRNWVWNQQKSWQNILFCQSDQFKRDEIGRIRSDFDVWSPIRCARIRAI